MNKWAVSFQVALLRFFCCLSYHRDDTKFDRSSSVHLFWVVPCVVVVSRKNQPNPLDKFLIHLKEMMRQLIVASVLALPLLVFQIGQNVILCEAFQLPQLQTLKTSRVDYSHSRHSTTFQCLDHKHSSRKSDVYSLYASSMETSEDNGDKKNGFRKFFKNKLLKKNPLVKLRVSILAFLTRFKSLSRKAKMAFLLQLVALSLILGLGTKRFVDLRTGGTPTTIVRQRPAEVSYSTFMDLMESNGKVRIMSTTQFD